MRLDISGLRFLVVDDNAHMRRIVRTLLHGFGVREVYEAEDGASGLEAFQNVSPDIVIIDWVMPPPDGLELVKIIRRPDSKLNPYVPIIMLTGHSERRRVLQARDAGVHEFLCKPISAKSLYTRITAIVLHPRQFVRTKDYFGPDRRRFDTDVAPVNERRKASLPEGTMDINDIAPAPLPQATKVAL